MKTFTFPGQLSPFGFFKNLSTLLMLHFIFLKTRNSCYFLDFGIRNYADEKLKYV